MARAVPQAVSVFDLAEPGTYAGTPDVLDPDALSARTASPHVRAFRRGVSCRNETPDGAAVAKKTARRKRQCH